MIVGKVDLPVFQLVELCVEQGNNCNKYCDHGAHTDEHVYINCTTDTGVCLNE